MIILQLQFLMANNQLGLPTILIDDGSQPAIKVAVKDAKIIVATFTHFLLRNIGKLFTNWHEFLRHSSNVVLMCRRLRDLSR